MYYRLVDKIYISFKKASTRFLIVESELALLGNSLGMFYTACSTVKSKHVDCCCKFPIFF